MSDGTPILVEYDGETYSSISSCAKAHGITGGVLARAIKRGKWRGLPIRALGQRETENAIPADQWAEHQAIERLLGKCSDNTSPGWR